MPASPPCTTGRTTRAPPRTPTPSCGRTGTRCCAPATPMGISTRCRADQVLDFTDIDRVQRDYFGGGTAFDGLVHLGVNLRGLSQSEERTSIKEMDACNGTRACPSRSMQARRAPNVVDAADYEKRGYLGPNFLICHYFRRAHRRSEAMARTSTPLSFATHSEFRLGRSRRSTRGAAAACAGRRGFRCRSTPPRSPRPICSRPCVSPGTWASRGRARQPRSRLRLVSAR